MLTTATKNPQKLMFYCQKIQPVVKVKFIDQEKRNSLNSHCSNHETLYIKGNVLMLMCYLLPLLLLSFLPKKLCFLVHH